MTVAEAGRSCPPHYGYSPRVFARAAQLHADTLYVIGGLYGNPFALDAIEGLASVEPAPPRLVFNGDFHWFDAEPALYDEIQRRVVAGAGHVPLRGNVETEIAADDPAAGCGCAYPESVPDDDVARSNAILARLRGVAGALQGRHSRSLGLNGRLPMHLVAEVGALRVAIVHGDAWSLAGWRFAHDSLHDERQADLIDSAFALGAVDGFACSHTCAPALRVFDSGFVINNGAAGMANFSATAFGMISRISVRSLPAALRHARVYGLHDRGVWIDALKVEFDLPAWLARFDSIWPAGSAAAVSYRRRMLGETAYTIDHALGRSALSCTA